VIEGGVQIGAAANYQAINGMIEMRLIRAQA